MAPNDSPMRIAISGASGFLGHAVESAIAARGHTPVPIAQRAGFWHRPEERAALAQQLAGCAALINCAGRAHVAARSDDPREWRALALVNRDFPQHLAQAARTAQVGRFVHVSSVAALASATGPGETIDDATPPAPVTPYGRSKLEGDRAVLELAAEGFEVWVLRPPALYGPGAKGWFPALIRAARLGLPLPLGAIDNRRSFAFVGNVADAIVETADAAAWPGVAGGAYVVTDSAPISSAEFYDHLCRGQGHGGRVWRLPPGLVKRLARIALGDRAASLVGDASFDGARFRTSIGWTPPFDIAQAMAITLTGQPC